MGDRSLKACIVEQLEVLRVAAMVSDTAGPTLQGWYDDGADLSSLVHHRYRAELNRNVTYAWGYLEGVADALDLTVMSMLEEHGLSFDADVARKRKAR